MYLKNKLVFLFFHLQTGKHKVLTKGVRDAARNIIVMEGPHAERGVFSLTFICLALPHSSFPNP